MITKILFIVFIILAIACLAAFIGVIVLLRKRKVSTEVKKSTTQCEKENCSDKAEFEGQDTQSIVLDNKNSDETTPKFLKALQSDFDSKDGQSSRKIISDNGDERTQSELVENNLQFFVNISKKFEGLGADNDNLVSIGTVGSIRSVDTFISNKNIGLKRMLQSASKATF